MIGILFSSLALAVQNPLHDPDAPLGVTLKWLNYIFTFIFLFEMIMKLLAFGLLAGSEAYLRSGWNILDGFIVVISCLDLILTWSLGEGNSSLGFLRSLRAIRMFRPLRFIARYIFFFNF